MSYSAELTVMARLVLLEGEDTMAALVKPTEVKGKFDSVTEARTRPVGMTTGLRRENSRWGRGWGKQEQELEEG